MKIEIVQKTENKLLNRIDIEAKATFSGATPTNADIQNVIAAELGVNKELVIIEHNYNIYGSQAADIFAKAYKDKKSLEKYEAAKKEAPKKKEEGGEAPAPAPAAPEGEAAPAGDKPAEAPAKEGEAAPASEAPAEEPKAEEKPEEKPAEKPAEEPKEEKPAEKPEEKKEGEK